jgi:uncharacterized membrane protein YeiB
MTTHTSSPQTLQQRYVGFDVARAYAIWGMFIVNFNFSFGSILNDDGWGNRFLSLFEGNSTAIFILCAGMGLSFMSQSASFNNEEKKLLKSKVLRRSWFLFALGLLLYPWWSGDILHFYGGYMHVAAFLLFIPRFNYLYLALLAIAIYHILLSLIPVGTGWDFSTFYYTDFWSITGFLRNSLYNGWNSLFPWIAYFFVGMWMGKLNWENIKTLRSVFISGLSLFTFFQVLRFYGKTQLTAGFWSDYLFSDYFPPYLPFMCITIGFAFMVISLCMLLARRFPSSRLLLALQKTGQMTLSLYVVHLTIGMQLFAWLNHKHYTGLMEDETPSPPWYILSFATAFYILCFILSLVWRKKWSHGPLEILLRKWDRLSFKFPKLS